MKPRDKQSHPVAATVAWLAALLMFFPIFWMVLASFKTETQAIADAARVHLRNRRWRTIATSSAVRTIRYLHGTVF